MAEYPFGILRGCGARADAIGPEDNRYWHPPERMRRDRVDLDRVQESPRQRGRVPGCRHEGGGTIVSIPGYRITPASPPR
mgnify:CR=1 FL=1